MTPEAHSHIADWVKKGGVLIYSGTDNDPFQNVREWWNTNGHNYATPSAHLLSRWASCLAESGEYSYGKGTVCVIRTDPKDYVLHEGGDKYFLYLAARMYEQERAKAGKLEFKNNFYLQRGDYDLAAVLEESVSDEPFTVEGCLIDLFDPKITDIHSKRINPGEQALLLNVERVAGKKKPQVLASASREEQEERGKGWYSYVAKSPAETSNVSRVLLRVVLRV